MRTTLPALLLALAACSTTDRMQDAQPTPAPGPDVAKVIVYRTSPFGEDAHFPIYAAGEGRLLGFTQTDCYFEVTCPPGKHLFVTWGEGEAFVEAELEAGKTYFIRAYSKFGILRPRPGLAPVSKDSEEWKELQEAWPTLRCRRLDPGQAAEFVARNRDRLEELRLRPDDGTAESVLHAK